MNNLKLTLLLVLFSVTFIIAQGENNNWYFGYGAGLHFNNNGSLDVSNDGKTLASEGVSSISSPEGELLFYTDGGTVYNRNHDVMSNGDNLFGAEGSTQSSLIVPLPQNPDRYYIFTVDATSPIAVRGRGLNYSIVDISLDNGNGAVVVKNTNLLRDCTEKVAAIIGDCVDEVIWIVTIATPTGAWNPTPPYPVFNTYHAFRMDATGVSLTSVASTFPINTQFDQGYLKFSPDGTKLANAHLQDGLYLSDFDKNTGVVSNLQQINITGTTSNQPYGVEFSPNGQYLYVHAFRKRPGIFVWDSALLQYDIFAADISGSQIIIEERDLFRGAIQLGPDGKIYRTLTTDFTNGYVDGTPIENGTSYLGIIQNPNEPGLACNYQHNAVPLQGNRVRQGLPPLVQAFFTEINLVPEDVLDTGELRVCLGDTLRLEAQPIPGATYTWEKDGVVFNNPSINTLEVPSSTMSDSGLYNVYVLRPGSVSCPIEGEVLVIVDPLPESHTLNLLGCDIDLDNYTDGITTLDLTEVENDPSLLYTYYVSEQDRDMDITITDPTSFRNTTAFNQQIYFKVTNNNGCENQGELNLTVVERPEPIMESEYLLCTNEPNLAIDGPSGFDSYQWLLDENGSREVIGTSQMISITTIGTYVLIVNVEYVVGTKIVLCSNEVIFEVRASSSATIDEIRATGSGNNKTIEVVANGEGDYEYSLDGVNFQDANTFENLEPGDYTAYVSDKLECGVTERQFTIEKDLFVGGFPKFFTPNGDGVNDYWQFIPPETGEINVDAIYIFNKYGQLMVELNPTSQGWDGIFNGRKLPSTDYWFKAISINMEQFRGHFALKR